MAIATDRIVAMISERAEVRRLVISVEERHGLKRHLTRAARTLRALSRMTIDRRRAAALYVGSDAGLGMIYTLTVVALGRLLGYRLFLHHHSVAYVNRPSTLMASIVRSGGDRCTHALGCESQAKGFDERYRPALASVVVPISFAVRGADLEDPGARVARPPCGPTLRLGHLSNLSVEKGLERVFETLNAALAAGLDAHLVLAGPAATARDKAVLESLLAQASPHVDYLGPADDETKKAFFDGIDVFLFPSRYRHESFGLVVGEAMEAGVPVITYRAGCMDAAYVGGGGLVLEPEADFAGLAARQLSRWAEVPEEWQVCSAMARSRAGAARRRATLGVGAFIELLIAAPGT